MPGMMLYRDVHFQLVDLPPISADYIEPWLPTALHSSDAALLVVDLADPGCVDHVAVVRERLAEKRVEVAERWPGLGARRPPSGEAAAGALGEASRDPFRIALPTLLVANKRDLDPDPDEIEALEELAGARFPAVSVSAETGQGHESIGPLLFEGLEIVRVYTKTPGSRNPDPQRPFTLRRGATVHDVARLVHNDFARSLSFARVWSASGAFEGQADFGALEALGTVDELYRRVLGEKQGDELFVRSSECIQARQHTLSIERPDLSYAPDATVRTAPAFDVVTLVRARPGQHEACEELIRKIAEAIPKVGDPTRLVTYQVVVGDLREYWTTRPLRRLADFDQQLATAELLNRAFGAAEGGLIWRSGNESIAEVRRELVAYREDLSNPPQS